MFLWNEKAIQIVAGPCSVESEEQLFATARGLKKIGIQTLRGGIWKPRSRAHHFEGVGESGLRWLQRVLQELSMQVATRDYLFFADQCIRTCFLSVMSM